MATADLKSRLSKISKSPGAKEVKQQRSIIARPKKATKPGPKNTWKTAQKNYVRLYTQLQESDRNLLKREVAGGALYDDFDSVDHFINEAVIRLLGEYGLESNQKSTVG
jgi:hypothetical protein